MWRPVLGQRIGVCATVLALWVAVIALRLVYLQLIQHDDLARRAQRQQMRTVEAPAKRADIVDRYGQMLAYSVEADTIYAVPTDIADAAKASSALCRALDDCTAKEGAALTDRIRKGRAFVYVRRQVTPEQARRVAALQLEGVGFLKENRRFYPNKTLAAHVLGHVGIDNVGLGGIEAAFDSTIKGRPGAVLIHVDAHGRAFSRTERKPTTGSTLELTIDEQAQHIVERELRAGVEWSGAAGGAVVVMDPLTGELLAVASYPTFNPNAYRQSTPAGRRNRAIQDLYEPGSTFKIITAAAALEEKVVQPSDRIDVSPGYVTFGSRVIRDDHRYSSLTFEEVVAYSSNVGAIRTGLKVGPERFDRYVRSFGFGAPLSPDFRGESAGIVWDAAALTPSALASTLIGYQVGVTPLQMATAVSAVANGGEVLQPRVVRAVIRDGVRTEVARKVLRRAISRDTAAQLVPMLESVVEKGTAKVARMDGYTVAGKTGTAKKLVKGSYRGHSDYNVSFVGFVPSRSPRFTIVVVVDSPHKVSPYGGVVAAPIFQRISEALIRRNGVPRTIDPAPPIIAVRAAPSEGQTPRQTTVSRDPDTTVTTSGVGAVPDLSGLSAREALRILAERGLTPRLHGAGFVVAQDPPAGTPYLQDPTATLWLSRRRPGVVQVSTQTP
ncbi:MAG TPA: penicillin-binding transpeptidase domain-containing protein [Vicinamibacterales bacterium]